MTPVLDQTDIEQFRTIVARRLGLHYEDGKLDYLAEVARQRMELVGSAHFESYLKRLISSPGGSDELRALAEQLTVNETFFFRNADNFRAFAGIILPERIRAKTRERRLRILSAGCASGEEPYSLAVLVHEALPDLENWDVKIIGVDVNPAILAKATQARYSAWSLRATPEDARRRYFQADGRDFVLAPAIQKMVTFEERNLVDEDPQFWESLACDPGAPDRLCKAKDTIRRNHRYPRPADPPYPARFQNCRHGDRLLPILGGHHADWRILPAKLEPTCKTSREKKGTGFLSFACASLAGGLR
jgi:chemotaxis protein methyltransferase CheR